MASIQERNHKYKVVYYYKNDAGERKQKWETYDTKAEARKRKKEIEYKQELGTFVAPKCTYLSDLLDEYVFIYGTKAWVMSTYQGKVGLIRNYIKPMIGKVKLSDLNTHFIEKYYQTLLETPAVVNPMTKKPKSEYVTTGTIREIHKLLRNCFEQAIKWELMEKNPCQRATVPKHTPKKRVIWEADTMMHAMDVCVDERVVLACNIIFAGTLRPGEVTALSWDAMDISMEAIDEDRAYIVINKELQRVSKEALKALDGKDVLLVFPETRKSNKTVRILKKPKTEGSERKVFIPRTVALMLVEWKKKQDLEKEVMGDEYMDYNLVLATPYGLPVGEDVILNGLKKLIAENNLPSVVTHSLRHTSVTYKLKLNGGDIKATQGDSGHSQANMILNVYSHILDDDRRKNAKLFEKAFYEKKELDPDIHQKMPENMLQVPEGVDPELLGKVLADPEMAALLVSMASKMNSKV